MIEHLEDTDAKVSFPTDVYADMSLYREYSVIITNGNDQLSCWLRIMYYVNITRLLAQVWHRSVHILHTVVKNKKQYWYVWKYTVGA